MPLRKECKHTRFRWCSWRFSHWQQVCCYWQHVFVIDNTLASIGSFLHSSPIYPVSWESTLSKSFSGSFISIYTIDQPSNLYQLWGNRKRKHIQPTEPKDVNYPNFLFRLEKVLRKSFAGLSDQTWLSGKSNRSVMWKSSFETKPNQRFSFAKKFFLKYFIHPNKLKLHPNKN